MTPNLRHQPGSFLSDGAKLYCVDHVKTVGTYPTVRRVVILEDCAEFISVDKGDRFYLTKSFTMDEVERMEIIDPVITDSAEIRA